MNTASIIQQPFVRLTVPFIAGIAVGERFTASGDWLYVVIGMLAVLLAAMIMTLHAKGYYTFPVLAFAFITVTGYVLSSAWLERSELSAAVQQGKYFQISVTEQPEEKQRSMKLTVTVDGIVQSDGSIAPSSDKGTVLAYVRKDSSSMNVQRGDVLLVKARIRKPVNDSTSTDFDYARYLRRKGVAGTTFVESGDWSILGHHTEQSLLRSIQDLRPRVEAIYKSLGFSGDNYSVLTAMTLGDKSGIDDEIQQTYSTAGVSHVLAMSGLHIGIIYGMLSLIAVPLYRRRRWLKPILTAVIVAFMWLFAIFAGLAPSIVRSVVMFSMLSVSVFLTDKPMSFNTLSVTAFVMLAVKPMWLFDVGFQMSFAAVASILLFATRLTSFFTTGKKFMSWVEGTIAVSVAAQLGTAPIVVYYFHNLPIHFLLSNLIILPIVTAVLYLAVLVIASAPFPWLQGWLSKFTDMLLTAQNDSMAFVAQLPFASIDGIRFSTIELVLSYVVILMAARAVDCHSARNVGYALAAAAVFLAVRLAISLS